MTDQSKDNSKNKQNNVVANNNTSNGEKKQDGFHFEAKDRALILKSMNLGPNDAYNISKKIKNQFNSLQKLDLSNNKLEDEGIIYISISLRMCGSLQSIILSNTNTTDYGLRMLLDSIVYLPIKTLDISGNVMGSKGADYLSKYISSSTVENLYVSSTKLNDDSTKALGIALSSNNRLIKFDVSSNNIKNGAAVLFSRGLTTNIFLQEIYLGNNNFGMEGTIAICDCIKYNQILKLIDLTQNQLNYDCAKLIAKALTENTTLLTLILDDNQQLTSIGAYDILTAVNTDKSKVELLSFRNISMLKHLTLIVDLIQQKRKFACNYGHLVINFSNAHEKDRALVKFSIFLNERNLSLIEMFKILDKNFASQNQMTKSEFIRRLKIFEPRLTQKDIISIADKMSDGDMIYYSSLFKQSDKSSINSKLIEQKKNYYNFEYNRMLKLEALSKKTVAGSKNFKSLVSLSNSTSNDDFNRDMEVDNEDLKTPQPNSYSQLATNQEKNQSNENQNIRDAKKNPQVLTPAKADQPNKKANNQLKNFPLKANDYMEKTNMPKNISQSTPVISNKLSQKISQARNLPLNENNSDEATSSPIKNSEMSPVISDNLAKKINHQAKNTSTKVDHSNEEAKISRKNLQIAPKAKPNHQNPVSHAKTEEVKASTEHSKINDSKIPRVILNKPIKPNNNIKPVTNTPVLNKKNMKPQVLTNSTNSSQILTPSHLKPSIEHNFDSSKVEYFEIDNNYPRNELKVVNNLQLPTALIQ